MRLEMLADAPQSYGHRLADVQAWDEARWRIRLASSLLEDSTLFVAADDDGTWLGQMAAREYIDQQPARVWLLEVYVTPALRATGLAGTLLAQVEGWARERGHARLLLDVHEDSLPARQFYRRHGFVETGSTHPYALDPTRRELEMAKDLS